MLTLYLREPRKVKVNGLAVHGGAAIDDATLKWKLQTTARADIAGATGTVPALGASGNYSGTVGPLAGVAGLTLGGKYLLVTYEDVADASRRHYRELEVTLRERGAS